MHERFPNSRNAERCAAGIYVIPYVNREEHDYHLQLSAPMSEAINKTKPTAASVQEYIRSRADETQVADCRQLIALLGELTAEAPVMWGPSIVGFGSYTYTYESGRTGKAPLVGFAIRGRELVMYLVCEGEAQKALLARLGKHRMAKCCLYLKRLADLDLKVLKALVKGSIKEVNRLYPKRKSPSSRSAAVLSKGRDKQRQLGRP